MATRSRIAIEREGGSVESIYCHWDGYPSNNGVILLENYTDRKKVEGLIALGDISSLDEEVEPTNGSQHAYDSPEKGVTVAYHRDRGEEKRGPEYHRDLDHFVRSDVEEYGYLFTKEGEWLFVDGHKSSSTREAIPLKSIIKE